MSLHPHLEPNDMPVSSTPQIIEGIGVVRAESLIPSLPKQPFPKEPGTTSSIQSSPTTGTKTSDDEDLPFVPGNSHISYIKDKGTEWFCNKCGDFVRIQWASAEGIVFPVCPNCFVDEMEWEEQDFGDGEVIFDAELKTDRDFDEVVSEAIPEEDMRDVSCG
jgi:hypothetical protein